jgi:hypothetical protein
MEPIIPKEALRLQSESQCPFNLLTSGKTHSCQGHCSIPHPWPIPNQEESRMGNATRFLSWSKSDSKFQFNFEVIFSSLIHEVKYIYLDSGLLFLILNIVPEINSVIKDIFLLESN